MALASRWQAACTVPKAAALLTLAAIPALGVAYSVTRRELRQARWPE
jgi:hypothetical protein